MKKNRTIEVGLPEGRTNLFIGENWQGDINAAAKITDLNLLAI